MSIVVIGGLGSVVGPILGALWVIGLPAFFPGNDLVPLLTSSVGLLVLLLYFPGGLVQIAYSARDALLDLVERPHRVRRPPSSSRRSPRRSRRTERAPLPAGEPALAGAATSP